MDMNIKIYLGIICIFYRPIKARIQAISLFLVALHQYYNFYGQVFFKL
jgi:hypothetical protein